MTDTSAERCDLIAEMLERDELRGKALEEYRPALAELIRALSAETARLSKLHSSAVDNYYGAIDRYVDVVNKYEEVLRKYWSAMGWAEILERRPDQ